MIYSIYSVIAYALTSECILQVDIVLNNGYSVPPTHLGGGQAMSVLPPTVNTQ